MTTVAVCLPSYGRAKQLEARAGDLLAQAEPAGVRLFLALAVIVTDQASVLAAANLIDAHPGRVAMFAREQNTTAVEGWNSAYQLAHGADWFVLGADDVAWRVGWLQAALAVAAETGAQVVGLNDGNHTDLAQYAPHYMASQWFCRQVLGDCLAPEGYRSWWFDREICARAQALDLYAPAWDAWAEHRHPDWYQAAMDETYELGRRFHDADRALYESRMGRGFAEDKRALRRLKEVA